MITKKKFIFTFEEICQLLTQSLELTRPAQADFVSNLHREGQTSFSFVMLKPVSMEVIKDMIINELSKTHELGKYEISVQGSYFVCEEVDDPTATNSTVMMLQTSLEDLDLSAGAYQALKRGGIKTLGDIVTKLPSELFKLKDIGKKRFAEVEELLDSKGLAFDVQV